MNPLWGEEKQPCAGSTYEANLYLALLKIKNNFQNIVHVLVHNKIRQVKIRLQGTNREKRMLMLI